MKPETTLHQVMGEFNRRHGDGDDSVVEAYRQTIGRRGTKTESRNALKRIAAASMKGMTDLY